MENGGSTTPKKPRPLLRRSHTASPQVSPPSHAQPTIAAHAAKKLHLHSRHTSKDRRSGRDAKEHHHHHHHHHHSTHHRSPGRTLVDTAKAASDKLPGVSTDSGRNNDPADERAHRAAVTPEDVERERQRQGEREAELHRSLDDLRQLAHSMTRQLDRIYYAILEKASSLHAAVDDLHKLLAESVDLRQTFEQDANDMKSKVQGQIDEFGGFEMQEHGIGELEGRIRKGTERAQWLSDRLEQARKRVERWEKREAEWQARTSGRIRASIISLSIVFAGVLFLLFLRWLYLNTDSLTGAADIRQQLNSTLEAFSIPFHVSRPPRSRPAGPRQTPVDDPRLRIFDEL